LPSGVAVGKSPGTAEGNGDGRAAIGLTAGPGTVIGRGDDGAAARGGSFVSALRRFGAAVRAFFFKARLLGVAFRLRAGDARLFVLLATFFLALRLFAMFSSDCF